MDKCDACPAYVSLAIASKAINLGSECNHRIKCDQIIIHFVNFSEMVPWSNTFLKQFCFILLKFLQMRHLFIVLDMSNCMEDQDLKPTRLACTVKVRKSHKENNMEP